MSDTKYFAHQRTEMIPFIPTGITAALDVGCASGVFGEMVKSNFNCEVWGVEPNKPAAAEASLKLDRVFNDLFTDQLDMGGKKFDVVFFNDVLEHLVDPAGALAIAKGHLKETGCIVSSIPNILHFETLYKIVKSRDWKYEESGVMDKTHLRFFTKKSIVRMFEESGFRVDVIQGINPYFFRFIYYLNKFTGNRYDEFKYPQFAVRAYRKNA